MADGDLFAKPDTPTPKRIQRSRSKGWRKPAGAVIVDRTSRWGNPYQAGRDGDGDPARLVQLYRDYLNRPKQAQLRDDIRKHLRGKDLVCWCPLDAPCHADVLLEIANAPEPSERPTRTPFGRSDRFTPRSRLGKQGSKL